MCRPLLPRCRPFGCLAPRLLLAPHIQRRPTAEPRPRPKADPLRALQLSLTRIEQRAIHGREDNEEGRGQRTAAWRRATSDTQPVRIDLRWECRPPPRLSSARFDRRLASFSPASIAPTRTPLQRLVSLLTAMSGANVSSGFYLMVTGQVDACQMQGASTHTVPHIAVSRTQPHQLHQRSHSLHCCVRWCVCVCGVL